MVEGVQPNSFAQAAAATLKLVRSAHNSTLPAKKTVAVSAQLIGRVGGRSVLADMVLLPGLCFSHPASEGSEDPVDAQSAATAAPLSAAWYGAPLASRYRPTGDPTSAYCRYAAPGVERRKMP